MNELRSGDFVVWIDADRTDLGAAEYILLRLINEFQSGRIGAVETWLVVDIHSNMVREKEFVIRCWRRLEVTS